MKGKKDMYILKLKYKKEVYFKEFSTLQFISYSHRETTNTKDKQSAKSFDYKEHAKNYKKNMNLKRYKIIKIKNIDNLVKELETTKKELKQKVLVGYKSLNIGDIINYDIELRNKNLKNETALILDKNDNMLKLSVLSNVWYCSIDMFYQLKNVSVIESD